MDTIKNELAYSGPDKAQGAFSDEIREIIQYRPGWFIRKGSLVFLLVILLVIMLAFAIKYPDMVKGTFRVTALNAPKILVATTEGRLEKLLVPTGTVVKKDQPLAFLQSNAAHTEVLQLRDWISQAESSIETGNLEIIRSNPLPLLAKLGELQPSYEEFRISLQETREVMGSGYYQQKKKALAGDIEYIRQLQQNLQQQKQLQQQDYALQKQEHDADKKLEEEKVIAPIEFNKDKSKLLNKEKEILSTGTEVISGEVSRNNKYREMLDIQKYISDQQIKFQSALLVLKSRMDDWIRKYIVTAPESGTLEYLSFLNENQYLVPGQELFYIQSPGDSYFAEMHAGQNGIGKVKAGQKVILRLAGYPSEEFGYIEGKVSSVSNIPNANDSFLVKVDLVNGLKTHYNRMVYFRNGLAGYGEIVTDNRKLADRLMGNLRRASAR
ncbi:MAG: hypothetical protein IPP93_18525 [Chitinophagaceae bacterium]|nr:hypothetical protein [Chitinophagaceae bacterium]